MREKLIELLSEDFVEFCNVDIVAGHCKIRAITFDADKFADYLIANGVTIPVRCKDCKYCTYDSEDRFYACVCHDGIDDVVSGDDFCSYGERRTDADC